MGWKIPCTCYNEFYDAYLILLVRCCRMAEIHRKGRKVRCWLGGQLLFFWGDFSFCIKTSHVRAEGKGCRVSLWGDDSRSVIDLQSNILYHIEYSSDHPRGSAGCPTSQTMTYLSEMPQMSNSQILTNILYPIEYSYDYTEVPAGYPTFSIVYLIYSTSQWVY